MKKIIVFMVVCVLLCSLDVKHVAAREEGSVLNSQVLSIYEAYKEEITFDQFIKLERAYRYASSKYEKDGYGINLSFDEFVSGYQKDDIEEYSNSIKAEKWILPTEQDTKKIGLLSSSGSGAWYYNTGVSLPQTAYYECTNMLSVLKRGDIMYENDSVTNGLVGHIGLVEGKYYSNARHCYYIRLVEAISPGVCRSVIDDERWAVKRSRFFRPSSYNSNRADVAVDNALSQLGKSWAIHAMVNGSSTAGTWYCSELAWWSYYNAGINFFNSSVAYPYSMTIIQPSWFTNSSNLGEISVN